MDQTVITLGNLRQELEKLHDPLLERFAEKVNAIAKDLKDYVDNEVGLIVTRLEALENRSRNGEGAVGNGVGGAGADDIREWLVVERLKFEDDEDLKFKISTLFEDMGVGDVSKKQVFRMGKSDNPRYIPVVKVQLGAAREVQAVVKNGHKLKHLKPGVYVRESRPKWVRDSEHNFRTLARSGERFTWRNGRLFPSTKSTNNTTE